MYSNLEHCTQFWSPVLKACARADKKRGEGNKGMEGYFRGNNCKNKDTEVCRKHD